MTSRVIKYLLAAVFLGTGLVHAQAQPRIGQIDLRKVFEGYYRTKEADAKIKEEFSSIQKTGDGMLEDYKKANEDYKQLMEAANDVAISPEEKQKRKKAAEDKLIDIRQLEQQVQKYKAQAEATISEKQRRMREQIIREIRDTVVSKAKTAGFTAVIDISAESVNRTPVFLYVNGENDMTDDIIKQLNAGRPAATASPPPAAEKKP